MNASNNATEELNQWDEGAADQDLLLTLPEVISLLQRHCGIDFSGYKASTLGRRLRRRMACCNVETPEHYLDLLKDGQHGIAECRAAVHDLLINVTEFFRDPAVFALLSNEILPDLLRGREAADELRIWSAGCASGEEAYTLAMLALDAASRFGFNGNIKVFATDCHCGALADASQGCYAGTAVNGIPEPLLRRYFQPNGENWQVDAALRRHVVFARHNLLSDPPFTRIDLVVCRNLLIYLKPEAQLHALAQIHFALKPQGLLLLGSSESVGEYEEHAYSLVDRAHKLFRKQPVRLARGEAPAEASMQVGKVVSPLDLPPTTNNEALLQAELQATRERLQEMLVELQSSHERIDLANEELTASNEELQSTNEELKSANEDLYGLNQQLEDKNKALLALNRDYDHLLASAEISTVFLDNTLCLRRFSPGVGAFIALRAQDIGRPITELRYQAGEQEEFIAALRRVSEQGERFEREVALNGSYWYLERMSPFRGGDGRRDGIVLTWTEISEVKRIRDLAEKLAEDRTRLLGILDAMPDGVYIVGREYDIEYMNPALERVFGAKSNRKCYEHFHERKTPCDFCKNPEVFAGKSVNWELSAANGRTYNLFDMPFHNPDGSISKLEIVHDITALYEARRYLTEAVALTQVGYWEWQQADQQLHWSDESYRCFGYQPGEVQPSFELVLRHVEEDERSRLKAIIRHTLETGDPYVFEFRFRRRDGIRRWARANGYANCNADGRVVGISGAMQDITPMREAEQQLQAAFRASPFAASIFRLSDGKFVQVNDKFKKYFGWNPSELIGKTASDVGLWPDPQRRAAWVEELQRAGTLIDFESVWHDRRGRLRHVSISAEMLYFDDEPYVLDFVQDITERKENEKRIAFLAHHDALTGLPNRVLFRERFELAMAWAERNDTRVALLFVDLDHFKTINDTLGHPVGDDLLKEVARRLRSIVRDTDTISRLGGDEFLLALTDVPEPESVGRLAAKIVEALAQPVHIEGHELAVTPSIGVTLWPDDGRDFDLLLQRADTAMYQAKAAGRNAYRFFTAAMNTEAMENLQLRSALRRAVENQEFTLYYQPQIDLRSRRVTGVEALLRWRRADGELISPERFIPIAEESGLIVPIGEWVLREACTQAVQWQSAGLPELIMAVNLSAVQFRRGNLERSVADALTASALHPGLLELELTESLLLDDAEGLLATLRRFKSLGVRLSIDDFGTGYSSLAYLKRFDVDKLKIDRTFVRDIATDPDDAAIVRAIISMARSLKLQVNAEGVENREIENFLDIYRCDEVQGYLYAEPMPAADLPAWLAQWRTGSQAEG
ncbi:Sensory box/GGDEF family protein (modular protein) [Sterolibacterium denitrificans]|uniref:protein-glutamate O-methyltransferase n=1 Tax=Sterolibacterium denitrificans TaxID=157592 RepID=A0A7Z7HRP9_9PROT|nr:EAL domain-containing protein [Sterolibacterium denitrificans]SMB27753.1 Sensory box/GGDEF family protein (modular protein) [Sterolibacterium denitrificans]